MWVLSSSGHFRTRILSAVAILVLGGCASNPAIQETRLGSGQSAGGPLALASTAQPDVQPLARLDASQQSRPLPQGAPASRPQNELAERGLDLVYFASDRSDLTPEARDTLLGQVFWLNRNPSAIMTIEGHADERGTREYNIALGADRAARVRNFLIQRGVDKARIRRVSSYGKERPVVVCDDISCWSRNRRVQTIVSQVPPTSAGHASALRPADTYRR